MNQEHIKQIAADYLQEQAEVLFLLLSRSGDILETNRYTEKLLGAENTTKGIGNVILDFSGSFNLNELSGDSQKEQLLNVQTCRGLPQTFVCRFFDLQDRILLLGRLNLGEIEDLRQELISSNNELHNLSRELQRKNAELARLNQLKNHFLGMAAHDLRKPVGIILNYTEFLADEVGEELNEEHRDFLRTILSSSDFMRRIIDDFLDVAKIESGKLDLNLQTADPGELLRKNLALHQIQARKKTIDLQVECPDTIPEILLDRSKIEQVLNNLVSNAIEHSFPKGRVRVTVSQEKNVLTVSVQDDGPGIPPDEVKKLFVPFGRSSAKKTGGEQSTGLGLAISHKIIDAHHGTIGVNSQPGEGSTFYFSLPVDGTE